jgi:hypothetical protein
MTFALLIPAFLSLVLLGAHFMRSGHDVLLAIVIFTALLAGVRAPWSRRIVQAVLMLGALEWLRTLFVLAAARMEAGMPYARLALILGAVAVLTGLSAVLLENGRLRRFYESV